MAISKKYHRRARSIAQDIRHQHGVSLRHAIALAWETDAILLLAVAMDSKERRHEGA
jgi:hypothetical protein